MMKFAIGMLLGVSACLSSAARAECSTQSINPNAPSVQSAYENAGLYQWNEGLQAWVLISAGYERFWDTEKLRTGDEPLSAELLSGGGGGGGEVIIQGTESELSSKGNGRGKGRGGADDPSIACHDTTLPPVVVTGSRPQFGSLLSLIWRSQLLARGGSGAARRPILRSVDANQALTCSAGHLEREIAARDVIRPLGFLPAGSIIRVNYGSGHYQLWAVTNPTATDRGLQPASGCISG